LLGQPYDQNLSICFKDQYENFGEVSRRLMSLYNLENQIYLFNNTKEKHPIFKNQGGEENHKGIKNLKTSPLYELLNFIAHSQIAAMIFESYLTEKQEELAQSHKEGEPQALLSFKTVDFTESYLSENLMNLLSRAEMYLSLAYPTQYPEHERKNPANIKLNGYFKTLEQQVKAYRDKLESLD